MSAISFHRPTGHDAYEVRENADLIARQNCFDCCEDLKNLITLVTVIAIAIFGVLLMTEWPILLIVAAPVVAVAGFSYISNCINGSST
jgi:hypothetical protein